MTETPQFAEQYPMRERVLIALRDVAIAAAIIFPYRYWLLPKWLEFRAYEYVWLQRFLPPSPSGVVFRQARSTRTCRQSANGNARPPSYSTL